MEQIGGAQQLVSIIDALDSDIKSQIASISIQSQECCYFVHVDLAIFLPDRLDIQQEVDLLMQGVHFSGWERHPGLAYILPVETAIAEQIMALGDSGVLGKIDAARFDCDDPALRHYYGYPHWLIKPITRPISKRENHE